MLTFINTNICPILIIVVWLWLTGVSGNVTCPICVGDSIQNCPSKNIIDSCPVCAKVVNVSGVHITGVQSYCDPTCQQVGCHDTTQSSCKLCCKSPDADCSLGQASKLLFCFFNLAVSFVAHDGLANAFTNGNNTSSPEYIMTMKSFNESLKMTTEHFRYKVNPNNFVTYPNGSVEFNININVYYRKRLVDVEYIINNLERTIKTSAANGSLRGLAKSTPSFRLEADQSINPIAQKATIDQEGCSQRKAKKLRQTHSKDYKPLMLLLSKAHAYIKRLLSSNQTLEIGDVSAINGIMDEYMRKKTMLDPIVVDEMLSILGLLMDSKMVLDIVVEREKMSSRFRKILHVVRKHTILKGGTYLFNSKNIGILIQRVSEDDQPKDKYYTCFLRTLHDDEQKVEMVVSNESSELGEGHAQVEIPLKEILQATLPNEKINMTRLTVMMIRKATFFETGKPIHVSKNLKTSKVYVTKIQNSWVVGVFAKGYNLTQLPRFFTIKFRKLNSEVDSTISMRWGADPFSDRETWIPDGCDISNNSDTTFTCITDRLGFITVLSENYTYKANYKRYFKDHFQYIALFGNAVCALESLITILAMLIFVKRIEIDNFYVLHLNFTTSILFSNISIMYAVLGHLFLDNQACELAALFLHHTLMVSHLWAVVFALFLFLYVGYRRRFDAMFRLILQVCLATWGVPAAYMAIVIAKLHATNGFTFYSQAGCKLHGLPELIFFLPFFALLLLLGVVLIVKTFLLPWQTLNERETQHPSVSPSGSTSTDTFKDSVTDKLSACLVFFLLLNVSSMLLYSVLWYNNMLVSLLYAIIVVFLGVAIMVMPWNFLRHFIRIKLPKMHSIGSQSSHSF